MRFDLWTEFFAHQRKREEQALRAAFPFPNPPAWTVTTVPPPTGGAGPHLEMQDAAFITLGDASDTMELAQELAAAFPDVGYVPGAGNTVEHGLNFRLLVPHYDVDVKDAAALGVDINTWPGDNIKSQYPFLTVYAIYVRMWKSKPLPQFVGTSGITPG